jgi:hypothetical protein
LPSESEVDEGAFGAEISGGGIRGFSKKKHKNIFGFVIVRVVSGHLSTYMYEWSFRWLKLKN